MGLFRSIRRIKPQAPAEGAGGKASDIAAKPQVVPGTASVSFDDFRAEVDACDLGDDWKAARLNILFQLFDLDGNGWVSQDEFRETARRLRKLLEALEEAPARAEEAQHEAAMPALLRDFTPLSKSDKVSAALKELKPLEEALQADPSSATKRAELASGLASPTAVLKAAIEARLAEQGIVPLCDAVISSGNDFFEDMYKETFSTISKSEEEDLELYHGRAQELIGSAKKGGGTPEHGAEAHIKWLQGHGAGPTAMQRYSDVPSLYAAALRARGGFAAVLEKLKAKVSGLGSAQHPVHPGPVKRTARILEKVLLQRENQGNADRVCDLVRALLVADSMAHFNNVLRAIKELHDEGAIVVVRVKDRVAHPSAGGWRDVMVNFYVTADEDRHVCEVQIVHAKMLAARKGLNGHAVYNRVRNASELLERLGAPFQGRDFSVAAGLLAEASAADQLKPTLSMLERATDASALPEVARTAALQSEASFVVTDGKVSFPSVGGSGSGLSVALLLGASESIDLSKQELGARHAALVAGYIRNSKTLKHLNLSDNVLCGRKKEREGSKWVLKGTYTAEGITLLCEGLKGSAVTSLNLGENYLGVKGSKAVAAVLKDTLITNLNICKNMLYDGKDMSGVLKLAEALPETNLTSLDLTENQLCGINVRGKGTYTAEGITALCEALKGSAVTSLIIADNPLTNYVVSSPSAPAARGEGVGPGVGLDDWIMGLGTNNAFTNMSGVLQLAEALPQTKLTSLDLRNNDLTNDGKDMTGVLQLADALPQTKLTSLNLARNQLCGLDEHHRGHGRGTYTVKGITALCEGLKGSAVTSLNISQNYLKVEGGKAVAAVLKDTQIANLNVLKNKLGDGADALLAAAREMPQLATLCGVQPEQADIDFSKQSLDVGDAKLLAFDLSKNQAIKTLNIGNNGLGSDGGKALAAVLKDTHLTNLNITSNELGVEGGKVLAEVVPQSKLTTLAVDDRMGSFTPHELLIDELKGIKPTEKIDLSGNDKNKLGRTSAFIIAACIEENGVLKELNLENNYLDDDAKKAVRAAVGSGVKLIL